MHGYTKHWDRRIMLRRDFKNAFISSGMSNSQPPFPAEMIQFFIQGFLLCELCGELYVSGAKRQSSAQ